MFLRIGLRICFLCASVAIGTGRLGNGVTVTRVFLKKCVHNLLYICIYTCLCVEIGDW